MAEFPQEWRDAIATATEQHHIVYDRTDAMGNSPCVCDRWWDAAGDNPGWDEHMAEVALAALSEVGALRDGQERIEWQWGVRWNEQKPAAYFPDVSRYGSEEQARDFATAYGKPHGQVLRRSLGPWQEVPGE